MVCSIEAVYEVRQKTEKIRTDKSDKEKSLAQAHPYISTFLTLVGVPMLMVGTVLGATTVILLPAALLLGWM